MLEGSIANLGQQYVLGLKATHCDTGDLLDVEQATAASKEHVLDALSQMASRFRYRVGESRTTMQMHDKPLEEDTLCWEIESKLGLPTKHSSGDGNFPTRTYRF